MWRAVVLFFLLPVAAMAQTIKVTSGEHDTFSRLVLVLPTAQPWQVGRTDSGYELTLEGPAARFDVSGVFDLIPKDRLKGIFVDPISGNLQMTVGCACHALPFSLNDSTIVIDLRDGPPPAASSFERGLDGREWAALTGIPEAVVSPRSRQPAGSGPTFDWTKVNIPPPPPMPFPMPQTADSADNIRESLVAQLADGAARAVITLALPEGGDGGAAAPYLSDDVPIRVTGSVGLQIGDRRIDQEMMQPDGQVCLPDDMLDLNAWAATDEAATQYAGLYNGLVGEFDRPQKDAIIAAAKRQIYLGFGAEARSLLMAFGDPATEDATLLDLAVLIDGEESAENGAFAGMASCDSAAAMWAFLADETSGAALNEAALKRTFSALPLHLRTHLGPRLIEGLVAAGRNDLAHAIRDSMGRGPVEDNRAIALATADVLMADDNASEAIPQLEAVMSDGGAMQAQALAKLVTAQIAAGQPVEKATADAIHAMIAEHEGHPLQDDLIAAYGLALAGSEQFAAAADFAKSGHPLDPAFWTLLAEQGTDDDLLLLAISPPGSEVPATAAEHISGRLEGLGFPDEAATWRNILSAENLPSQVSESATAEGDVSNDDRAARLARWDQNWPLVAQQQDSAWGELASGLTGGQAPPQSTTLASATESLSRSAEARTLIEQLITETSDSTPSP